ncbi:hypothetical protein [Nostoc sp. TCL26-01]|uniref:hypothetical protein n=1 Tax=Nostoc sp. TCL26-01 TaxID=2576904 RepID=UPI0015C078E2|nr:hypothetical protein [Nostoc sp. TCL26-01]
MNKFTKVLVLTLILTAPVAISATLIPASPATAATAVSRHHKQHRMNHKVKHKISRHHIRKHHKSVRLK